MRFLIVTLVALAHVALAEAQERAEPTSRVRVIKNHFVIPEADVSFTVPEGWLRSSRYFRLDSAQLSTVQKDTTGEWSYENGTITDEILPFTDCLLHIGDDGWGVQAHGVNVQMRAYLTEMKPEEITKTLATKGVETAVKVKGRSVKSESKDKDGWRIDHVGFDLWYHDYGGRAGVYFYSRPCKGGTLVLVFMLIEHERTIKARDTILSSFTSEK